MDDDFYTEFRKHHTKRHFNFPEVPVAGGIAFESLTPDNATQLHLLFENDDSPFVDDRFKTIEEAKDYAKFLEFCGAYTAKHGGHDWLFRFVNGQYLGVLHLHDLSLETFAQNNKRAWIGFATNKNFRMQGITSFVVCHFIQYIFESYPVIDFIHAMTEKNNLPSINFLKSCGFLPDHSERLSKEHRFFILTRHTLS